MKSIPIIIEIGGRSKRVKDSSRQISYSDGPVYGLTEYYGPKNGATNGCKVWIYSRQSKREMADTFFHEMTHVFLHLFGGVKKQGNKEEFLCRWIGYLAKLNLADYSNVYTRTRKRRVIVGHKV